MIFFFKQKTAYEMRISDWSSDVCSSDLPKAEASEDEAHSAADGDARSAGPDAGGEAAVSADAGEDEEVETLRPLPDRLVSDLTAWRTLALQDAFAQDPATAFASVLHALVLGCFYSSSRESCVPVLPNRVYFTKRSEENTYELT